MWLHSRLLHLAAALLVALTATSAGLAAPQTGTTTTGPPADIAQYRIGPNDLLSLEVFGVDDFSRKVRVLRDGTVSIPLLGSVEIGGKSLEAAEGEIARRLRERDLVRDPQVTLFVEEFMSRGVSVQGAVQRPGVYQMLGTKTLLEVIGEAGGLTGREGERAGRVIYVMRGDATGQQVRLEIDGERLMNEGDPDLNIPLRPGDVVVVPFDRRFRVYVSGSVRNPGAVEYQASEGITLLQAITAAGGPDERAKLSSVFIKRRLESGEEQQIRLNLKRIRNGKEADVELQRNDTVVVGDWFF